ncbi:MAG: L-seryl-tRNA(Sec) selenium transferase, partial [SAR202 cluster bacterium]|nr:L-seryl-tRNA(Sec) selenium transferase [SAR202 cluster bacterium]
GVLLLHDLGSGSLLSTETYGLAHEPTPPESVAAGADLTCFSTDKLLGGPQGGIVVGKKELIDRLARHPLARAMRMDKLDIAALSTTLLHYLQGDAVEKVPVWRMIAMPVDELEARARRWQAALGEGVAVIPGESTVGGGSLPGETLPTRLVALPTGSFPGGAPALLARLREQPVPIIARVVEDRVVLDPRTVSQDEEVLLLRQTQQAMSR